MSVFSQTSSSESCALKSGADTGAGLITGLNYIDGEFVTEGTDDAAQIAVTNPASGKLIGYQHAASTAQVAAAVEGARRLTDSGELSRLAPQQRSRMLHRMAEYLQNNCEEIAQLLTSEQGKPLWESRIEITGCCRFFEYYANLAESLLGQSIPLGDDYLDFTLQEPLGVTAHVIPWNYPLETAARSVAPAIAAGNACIVKTPEQAPLSGRWLASAAEYAGLPAGSLSILGGYGPQTGADLVRHEDLDLIVFTGSVATGKAVGKAAAESITPVILELGGKSAAVVYDDADIDAFMSDVRFGIFFNAGQTCSAMSRVLIHESRYAEFLQRAQQLAESIRLAPGDRLNETGMNMGPVISVAQREQILAMTDAAGKSGARVLCGGQPADLPGAFMQPTIVADVTPDMAIAQQEVFGPVLCVMPFKDEAEAIRLANSTRFGLVGGVFTRDLGKASRTLKALRCGQVFVNEWFAGGVETPFGGRGQSGFGREKGREALFNYVQTKNVAIRIPAA